MQLTFRVGHVNSISKVEKYAKQEISVQQVGKVLC
jgi:hypothetical protein